MKFEKIKPKKIVWDKTSFENGTAMEKSVSIDFSNGQLNVNLLTEMVGGEYSDGTKSWGCGSVSSFCPKQFLALMKILNTVEVLQ